MDGGTDMKASLFALALLSFAACSRSGATDAAAVTTADPPAPASANAEKPGKPMDLAICDRVREAFLRDKRVAGDADSIRVATLDGVVTLRGFVTTDVVMHRAAVVAKAVGSVVRVDNQLVVDADAAARTRQHTESVLERAISDRVRLALRGDRTTGPEAGSVSVLTQKNTVSLTGTVSSDAVKARCTAVARAVGSVNGVDNRLEVRKP